MKQFGLFLVHGLKTIVRRPGRTILCGLMLLLVTVMLCVALGTVQSVSDAIETQSERYRTIGVLEYLNGETEADPQEISEALEKVEALGLPEGASSWEPNRSALGYLYDNPENLSGKAVKDKAVLVVRVKKDATLSKDRTVTALVLDTLFSRKDVQGHYIEVRSRTLTPGQTYLIAGDWYVGSNHGAFLEPYDDPAPLPLASEQYEGIEGAVAFMNLVEYYHVLTASLTVRACRTLADYPAFEQQTLHLTEGRMFTEQEEASGAKVLLMSEQLSEKTGFSVGDRVRLGVAVRENAPIAKSYTLGKGFDLNEEYTVAGLFNANIGYNLTLFIPVPSELDMTVNHADTMLGYYSVKNEEAEAFLMDLEPRLPDALRLTVFDQGYAAATKPMREMRRTLGLIAAACLLIWIGFLVLNAWLFVNRQKRDCTLMLRLGAPRSAVPLYFLSGMLPIALIACFFGVVLGRYASVSFTERINEVIGKASSLNEAFSSDLMAIRTAASEIAPVSDWRLYACTAAAVGGLALICCLVFALGSARSGRKRRSVSQRRVRVKTDSLRGGSWKYAYLSAKRGGFRAYVTVLAACAAALLFCFLSASTASYRDQLSALKESSMVKGSFTDLYGQTSGDLLIYADRVFPVIDLEDTLSVTVTLDGDHYLPLLPGYSYTDEPLDPTNMFPTTEIGTSVAKERFASYPRLIFTNSMKDVPQFLYTSDPAIEWHTGWDESFLSRAYAMSGPVQFTIGSYSETLSNVLPEERGALGDLLFGMDLQQVERVPCVVSADFLRASGLKLGDTFTVLADPQIQLLDVSQLLIVGSYVKTAGKDNIYLPIQAGLGMTLDGIRAENPYRTYLDTAELTEQIKIASHAPSASTDRPRVSSAVFRFSCRDLDGLKRKLAENGLTEVNSREGSRTPFLLEDSMFLETASAIERRLWYMERIFPVVVVLCELLALILAIMQVRARRNELRLLLSLGTQKLRTLGSFFHEQAVHCMLGVLLGLFTAGTARLPIREGFMQSAVFVGLWLLGTAVTAVRLSGKNVRKEG